MEKVPAKVKALECIFTEATVYFAAVSMRDCHADDFYLKGMRARGLCGCL